MGNLFAQPFVLKAKPPSVLVVANMTANLIAAQQRVDQIMANADSKHVAQIQISPNRVVNNDDVDADPSPRLWRQAVMEATLLHTLPMLFPQVQKAAA